MARAAVAFHFTRPESWPPQVFLPGDQVPDDIAELVGEHVLDFSEADVPEADTADDDASGADAGDDEGDLSDLDNLDGGDDDEDDEEEAVANLFDPNDHKVDEVLEHLEKSDEDERERVLTLERDGQARKGILGDED